MLYVKKDRCRDKKKERGSNKLKWHPKITALIEVAVTENLVIITYLTFNEWLLFIADFLSQWKHSICTFVLEPVNICS